MIGLIIKHLFLKEKLAKTTFNFYICSYAIFACSSSEIGVFREIIIGFISPFIYFSMLLAYFSWIKSYVIKNTNGYFPHDAEFLNGYQLDHKSFHLQPRGLTNRSNYCYINAILQALIACPPFYNLMKSIPPSQENKNGKSRTPIIDSM